METKKLAINIRNAILAITLSALALILVFIFFPALFELMDKEVFKLTYQFLLLVVLGGAISLLFTLNLKLREEAAKVKDNAELERKQEKKIQRDFYHNFVEAFNTVKKIRRFLRARSRKKSGDRIFINTLVYDELMKELTIAQLKFEFFCKEVGSNPAIFRLHENDELLEDLKRTKNYLNEIVEEFELCYDGFPEVYFLKEMDFIGLEKLPKLAEFISPFHASEEFKTRFKQASENISNKIFKLLFSN